MMLGGLANTGFTNSNEEISTIFVVGFPDDMQEREFQNMFIFSPGFEAATLKIPNYTQEDVDPINGSMNNTRKQIIGFAKFRSRLEALEARDILSGRKVDAEKGSVLKAEMAKKNLHTKRGLSNDQQQQQSCPGTSYPLITPSVASARKGFSAYDAFYSVPALPSDLLTSQDYAYECAYGNGSGVSDHFSPSISSSSAFGDVPFTAAAQISGFATALEPKDRIGGLVTVQRSHSAEGLESAQVQHQQQQQQAHQQQQDQQQQQQQLSNPSRITASFAPSHMSRLNSVKSLLDLPNLSTSTASELGSGIGSRSLSDLCCPMPQSAPPNESRGFHSALFGGVVNTAGNNTNGDGSPNHGTEESINVSLPTSVPASGLSRFAALSINTTAANNLHNSGGTFANSPSTILSPGYLPSPGLRSSNPGDQNPPCNTLYVGNLPANTNEEELRMLFSKCVGYKRMCFRTKANGPMCFVEFDDVMCATQALHDLYGNPLSNSVKGGIRLSYSKNPLGVRQHPTFPTPVSVPNGSMYIPNGPLSAPPTTTATPPFNAFGPITRDIMGSAPGPYMREGNGCASTLLREGMAIERTGSASSIGTIGQPAPTGQQCCGTHRPPPAAVNNNNNMAAVSFGLVGPSNSASPILVPVGFNNLGKIQEEAPSSATAVQQQQQQHGNVTRAMLRTLSFETVSAFLSDESDPARMDPSPVKTEYEPQIAIDYSPVTVDARTETPTRDTGAS